MGVETLEQAVLLQVHRSANVQGFFIALPLSHVIVKKPAQ
jgi:EAL domain-containing protein (putative c-di-GMP-specific phosphodiesterase class I)